MCSYVYAQFPIEDSPYGVRATNPELARLPLTIIPVQKGDKIATLNQTGFMKTELDPFSQEFIMFSKGLNEIVLEIGAAYGSAAIPLLKENIAVIVNDIDIKHLSAVYQRVPLGSRDKLYFKLGYFPNDLEFPENSLGAVLMCRIAHFLNGDEISSGLTKIYKWLKPGGKLYFASLSPYHHLLRDKFLPIYDERLKNGVAWPGIILNMKDYNPVESQDIPNFLHVSEPKVMSKLLEKHRFIIEKIELFDYSNNSSNNQGYLGFVAIKPSHAK